MRIFRALLVIALLATAAPSCGSTESDSGSTLVVVDSDGAFDDIKAILFLLRQPDVEIVALTLSGTGIAHCPAAAENVAALLARIDAPEIPVACGRSTPLAGDNQAPQVWRDSADTLGNVALPPPRPLAGVSAPELLIDVIGSASRDVTLVALGPLTNVAEALRQDSGLLDKVEMMYLMGGAVEAGGNVLYGNAAAEFNIWADPVAAVEVLATDVPITLVPLDATNDLPVTPYLYDAVDAHRDASLISAFMADYLDVSPLLGGIYHWDELAAVAATDESVVTIEDRLISITTGPEGEEGVTQVDPGGRPVRVAVAADRGRFEAHFYKAIVDAADPGVPAWAPDAVVSWDGADCSYTGPDPLPDEFYLQIDNESDRFVAFLTGAYDAGTTAADFFAALEDPSGAVPDWWLSGTEIFSPAGAHDVYPVRGGEGLTALCWAGPAEIWELAGVRLVN